MRALITGGAGFIGSHLAEALLERGEHVTVVDDLSTGRFENIAHLVGHPRFGFAIETVTNETVMDRLVSECDVILHLAAAVGVNLIVQQPVHTIETNVLGTGMVLRLANRYRRKVLVASTSEVYGKGVRVPFSEEDDRVIGPTSKSRWAYATSKAVDEFLALAYHREKEVPVVVLRFFNTVGPRQRGRYGMVIPRFVSWALAEEPIQVYGDGRQSRCFCHVADAVRAIMGLMDEPAAVGEIFNIGSDEEVTIDGLAKRVKAMAGSSSDIVHVPYDQAYAPGFEDMRRRVPDIAKIGRVIGWKPSFSLERTLEQIIDSIRAAGPIGP
jgi:UDP-glucose 4-epimerase